MEAKIDKVVNALDLNKDGKIDNKDFEIAKNALDLNKDGDVNINDVKYAIQNWKIMLPVIMAVIFWFLQDDIMDMILARKFDWNMVIQTLTLGSIVALFRWLNQQMDIENKDLKDENKKLKEENAALKNAATIVQFKHEAEIIQINNKHEIEDMQLKGAMQQKNQEIEWIRTGDLKKEAISKLEIPVNTNTSRTC